MQMRSYMLNNDNAHTHLVHARHHAVQNFTLEGPKRDALEECLEGGKAAAILPDLALRNAVL
jgi:hypothetical protein